MFSREACRVLSRQILLEELKVFEADRRAMMVVSYEASGLQTLDEGILFLESPVEFLLFVVPHSIEPNGSNRAVIGQKLSQLTVHESIVAVPIRG